MTNRNILFFSIISMMTMLACNQKNGKNMANNYPNPPTAEKIDCVLTMHGNTRIDPYFWMRLTDEQKNTQTPDEQTKKVLDYLNAENQYADTVMSDTKDLQEKLFNEITSRIKKDDESVPYFKDGYWYYSKYEKGKEYPIHCRKEKSLEAEEQILLDVNKFAEGQAYYSVGGLSVSPNNKILAFGEDNVSRRIYTIRFLNLETGKLLPDKIENTTGSGAWANDNKTYFFTTKDKVSLLSDKIWRHTLGTKSNKDIMVFQEKDPSFYIGVYKSKSGKYIIITESSTITSDYYILNANTPEEDFKQFTERVPNMLYSISHFEDKFYVTTNWEAENFRLMETSENKTDRDAWKEIIPHRKEVLLEGIDIFKHYLVLSERFDALPHIRIINQDSKEEHYLEFKESAYVAGLSTNVEFDTDSLRFMYSSMTTPTSVYDYNMKTREKILKKQTEVVGGHNPDDYVTERIYATSRDGKEIPMSVVYKKGFQKNGKNPLLLYGYGSYGANIDPWFSSTRLSLLDRGFAWVIAHIRGSEFKGRNWYEDGKMLNKKNTFNDFIDCSDFLVKNNYTSYKHLYAMGGSAGGLLMGAILNMAPEKYNGVIAAVPFVDVVSTMLDETIPLTTNEFDEWGNPKNKEYYDYMLSYSPYDQVKKQNYPNLLITTGLFDSQVQYWEPAKWIAKLRDYKTDKNLLIMHTNMEAGHGGASGRFKRYRETAMEYAFFIKLEGIKK